MRITNVLMAGFIVVMIVSCSATGKKEKKTATSEKETTMVAGNSDEGKPIQMNKEMFLKIVYNYEKNPKTWVYEGEIPCIIDFYADWCGPCKRVAPIIEELAKKYKGKINFYKINTDREKELASAFGIQSIPSVLFCPMNGQPQMTQGALPKDTFQKIIGEVILNNSKTAE